MIHNVFIIGAGAMGLSAAIELRRRGTAVTVVDQGLIDGMSSWAGAGILSPLPPWGYGEAVSQLALAGMRAWPEWAAELENLSGISPEFWPCGMRVTTCEDSPKAMHWCESHQLQAEIRSDGIWLPTISQVRNPRLLAAMKKAFLSLGGEMLPDCKVRGFNIQDHRVVFLQTSQGELAADRVVLATGAWSALPLGKISAVPHIRPIRGQMLLYAPGSHTLDHIILDSGFYLVPRKDGHLLAGSTIEEAGFEAITTAEALGALQEKAGKLLPSLKNHDPIKNWSGLRPGSPGNLPVIDRHPDFENLWVHTGHFRYGVTMAPASSRLLVELMTGEIPFLDPGPYSWEAAKNRTWTSQHKQNV